MIHTKLHKPKINISTDKNYKAVKKMVQESYLNTVCAEARCPNIYECWNRKTATLMILGDTCTRACGFCSVKTGKPTWNDPLEPLRVAQAVKKMGLRHVVITSVDRDDLKGDYGASIWADTIKQTKKVNPECTVEVLTPDFKGYEPALKIVFDAKPDIFIGSNLSNFSGLPVFTSQKAHALVHVSPMIINVACLLLQHSVIFGQLAS